MVIDPVSEVRNLSIDPKLARIGTAKAPADGSDQGLSVVVGRIPDEERTSAVALASIFPSLHDSSTEHVRGHVLVHLAAVAVSEHGDVDLVKSGR